MLTAINLIHQNGMFSFPLVIVVLKAFIIDLLKLTYGIGCKWDFIGPIIALQGVTRCGRVFIVEHTE